MGCDGVRVNVRVGVMLLGVKVGVWVMLGLQKEEAAPPGARSITLAHSSAKQGDVYVRLGLYKGKGGNTLARCVQQYSCYTKHFQNLIFSAILLVYFDAKLGEVRVGARVGLG